MGRTPLFRMLQRAARIARASQHTTQPLDELLDAAREHRVDITSPPPAPRRRAS